MPMLLAPLWLTDGERLTSRAFSAVCYCPYYSGGRKSLTLCHTTMRMRSFITGTGNVQ